jgi:hypothetical protein
VKDPLDTRLVWGEKLRDQHSARQVSRPVRDNVTGPHRVLGNTTTALTLVISALFFFLFRGTV